MGAKVLIVFWSRAGDTEKLALAAAVGAVQGRGAIRLRWLKESNWDSADSVWSENRKRMEAEYIQPRVIDIEWADGIFLASSARVGPQAPEWREFFRSEGLRGKRVGVLAEPRQAWEAACKEFGLVVVPLPDAPDLLGAATATGRALADSNR